MITENLSTLKINKLTQEQYNREFAAGRIDENALYLTPDDSVGEKIENNNEIFNDYENNQAVGDYAHAEGYNTKALGNAFVITAVDKNAKTFTLSEVPDGLAQGMTYSCQLAATHNNVGKISSISGNVVTVDVFPSDDTMSTYNPNATDGTAIHANFLWIPDRPDLGNTSVLNFATHAEGWNTTASSVAAHAEGYNTKANGKYSHAEGRGTTAFYGAHAEGMTTLAQGLGAHAEGHLTKAMTQASHAEGDRTHATGYAAHAEGGEETEASGDYSHAEGYATDATAEGAHAEGRQTVAAGKYSHAEGESTSVAENTTAAHAEGYLSKAKGSYSHAEGYNSQASSESAHAEGSGTIAGYISHAEGLNTKATGSRSHAEGSTTTASGAVSHAEGSGTIAQGNFSHAENNASKAYAESSHAEGINTTAGVSANTTTGQGSHTEGSNTRSTGYASHAEGYMSKAAGEAAHSEGRETNANGDYSHAEGYGTSAYEQSAHAEGFNTKAYGYSHAEGYGSASYTHYTHTEGYNTKAGTWNEAGTNTCAGAHAEGYETQATGIGSHAEGRGTAAQGYAAHAEGINTIASGDYSHAAGQGTIASNKWQTVVGIFNKDIADDYLFTVGNGSSDTESRRSNAFVVHKGNEDSNANFYGWAEVQSQGETPQSVVIKETLDNRAPVRNAPIEFTDGASLKNSLDKMAMKSNSSAGWYASTNLHNYTMVSAVLTYSYGGSSSRDVPIMLFRSPCANANARIGNGSVRFYGIATDVSYSIEDNLPYGIIHPFVEIGVSDEVYDFTHNGMGYARNVFVYSPIFSSSSTGYAEGATIHDFIGLC